MGDRRRTDEPYELLQRLHDNEIEPFVLGRGDGAQITVPRADLIPQGKGGWLLSDAVRDSRGLVIPVVEETLEVNRERVEAGRAHISKTVEAPNTV